MKEPVALDLRALPFTQPMSRLMLRYATTGELHLATAEYEIAAENCEVVCAIRVDDAVPTLVRATAWEVDFGTVTATFCGTDAVLLRARAATTLQLRLPSAISNCHWQPGLPSASDAHLYTDGTCQVRGATAVVDLAGGQCLRLGTSESGAADYDAARDETRGHWERWFERCPQFPDRYREMGQVCWWVLGANQLELHGHPGSRAVVPSKLGYVALWQWDAYFIARGLRHGDRSLARHQLELAVAYQDPTGQLPDVIHDGGVLASSDDLPPADLATLIRKGSGAAGLGATVPLTKPPLLAWAAMAVAGPTEPWRNRMLQSAAASQEWWFSCSDADADGVPEYAHPYNSGLDDSPIFDVPPPVMSPDLVTYLAVQDRILANWREDCGQPAEAAHHRARAARLMGVLAGMWSDASGHYQAQRLGESIPQYTVVSLLPVLAGVPQEIAGAIVAAVDSPNHFGAPCGLPTVSRSDCAFEPDTMWRGPSWTNVGYLVAEGLEHSGRAAAAASLRTRLLESIMQAGGPWEYINPLTGRPGHGATSAFGWTAALFVDMAVRHRDDQAVDS